MDITTVNDRHLYSGTVRLRDPERPGAVVELVDRVVRFGPPGWLTVADPGGTIALYPTSLVVAVTELGEAHDPDQPVEG
ncbi:protein of unknown function [Modestobacter italicus]|uniref:Uncharacterized protein n=1 Tax=Modestobacter italicus (strain DSM 44449 / CECT 9708 / BC 501) TaxID=2732864 RepID=I4EWB1_MODI5|nr:hypothetical protein [Modestobacter marinus]CCH87674.1 protein of unknown function [Modestobacter marinus]